MQLVDHTLGLVIHSDVAELTPHLGCGDPVGSTGGVTFVLRSPVGGAVVLLNGVPQAATSPLGWRVVNSPGYDGGGGVGAKDTVCYELFDGTTKIRQWSAFLSSGNVRIVR
jgi:hypothetical protein